MGGGNGLEREKEMCVRACVCIKRERENMKKEKMVIVLAERNVLK